MDSATVIRQVITTSFSSEYLNDSPSLFIENNGTEISLVILKYGFPFSGKNLYWKLTNFETFPVSFGIDYSVVKFYLLNNGTLRRKNKRKQRKNHL